jgi:hypothetical protein
VGPHALSMYRAVRGLPCPEGQLGYSRSMYTACLSGSPESNKEHTEIFKATHKSPAALREALPHISSHTKLMAVTRGTRQQVLLKEAKPQRSAQAALDQTPVVKRRVRLKEP